MQKEKRMKLVVNNTTEEKKIQKIANKHVTNPIYGRYLEFTSSKTKKKISIRDFLNELF